MVVVAQGWAERRLEVMGDEPRSWEKRHPAAAAREREFRKQRRTIRKDFGHKVHATPETAYHASRVRQGAIASLHRAGVIDNEQLGAALQIADVHERIARDVIVRTMSLETRVDVTRLGDSSFFERLGAVWAEMAYTAWRARLPGPAAPILDMIAGDISINAAARRYRMDKRRAKQLLLAALDLWPEMHREARDTVDEATLLAAHAGILS